MRVTCDKSKWYRDSEGLAIVCLGVFGGLNTVIRTSGGPYYYLLGRIGLRLL